LRNDTELAARRADDPQKAADILNKLNAPWAVRARPREICGG
jgi:hypothetical protein